jgi:hypothetical protein
MIKSVFAIVKDGRRLEDVNYLKKESAVDRLSQIANSRKSLSKNLGIKDDLKLYKIVELEKPNKIW